MDINNLGILQLRKLLDEKKISSKELFDEYKTRAITENKKLNAFLTICDYKENPQKGILSGIPIAIKDNFCTKGIRTTASSKVLDNFIPPYNATVVNKLLNAGATILGKTNMDAWAHGSSTETSDYGCTKNPHDITRTAGGSSGGSASAVVAELTPVAIGSETGGSIKQPAAWCGCVGFKPTYGKISRYGLISMGSSYDCPGPMTTTVEDTALLLSVLAGHDEYDATSSDEPIPDYIKIMNEKRTFTIGYAKEYVNDLDKDIEKSFFNFIKILQKLGHTVKEISLMHPKYVMSVYTITQRAEVSSNLSRYDGVRFGNDRTYFGAEAKRRIMLGTYTLTHGYYDAYYNKAQKVRSLIASDFQKAFSSVDLIIGPTTPVTALPIGDWEKYPFFGEKMDILNEPACVSGIPAISIPFGKDSKGLPIGMQFMANYHEEGKLLNISKQVED